MPYSETLAEQRIEAGRRRLKRLLPWARAEMKKSSDMFVKAATAIARSSYTYVTEDNLDSLVIYEAPLGGWHCDLRFKDVPPGIANAMGTPVGSPKATKAEAEEFAKILLLSALYMAEQNRIQQAKPADPVFQLYHWSVTLPRRIFESVMEADPEFFRDHNPCKTHEQAVQHVERTLKIVAPDGFKGDEFNKWEQERKVTLMQALFMASAAGLLRYPPYEDAPPDKMKH